MVGDLRGRAVRGPGKSSADLVFGVVQEVLSAVQRLRQAEGGRLGLLRRPPEGLAGRGVERTGPLTTPAASAEGSRVTAASRQPAVRASRAMPWLLISPGLTITALFLVVPLCYLGVLSLTRGSSFFQ